MFKVQQKYSKKNKRYFLQNKNVRNRTKMFQIEQKCSKWNKNGPKQEFNQVGKKMEKVEQKRLLKSSKKN